MTNLGQIIRDLQREAAALPTGQLRTEIEISLHVQDEVIGHFSRIRPGAGHQMEIIGATTDVLIAVLTTAIYVRELTSRPAPRVVAWVGFSRN